MKTREVIGVVSRNLHHFAVYCMENGIYRDKDGIARDREDREVFNIQVKQQLEGRRFVKVVNNIYVTEKVTEAKIEELTELLTMAQGRVS